MPTTLIKETLPAQSLSSVPKTRVDWGEPVTVIDLTDLKDEVTSALEGQPKLIHIDRQIDFGPSDGAIAIGANKVIKIASTPGHTYALDAHENSNIIDIMYVDNVELYLENIILRHSWGSSAVSVYGRYNDIILQSGAILEHNESLGWGGAIGLQGRNCNIEVQDGAIVRFNKAEEGGGISIAAADDALFSTLTVQPGALIDNNTADFRGGGILVYGGSILIDGGTISNNRATDGGGVSFIDTLSTYYDAYMHITGGLFTKNAATYGGGAISTGNAVDAKISGNTQITYNKANIGGGICASIYRAGRRSDIDETNSKLTPVDLLISDDVQISYNTAENGG
ncbi:hypothetical protein AGMMS49992_05450 [Clostridia bacterium]|nr:hypothetical protein AGMMS49992_05450 [Clostridia bacterium]